MNNVVHKQKHCDKIGHFFDVAFWYIVYLLPIFLLAIAWFKIGNITLAQVFIDSGLAIKPDNPIFVGIDGIFGNDGLYPIFASNGGVIQFLSYFVNVFLFHILIDLLLFVYRAIHRFIGHGFGGADHE